MSYISDLVLNTPRFSIQHPTINLDCCGLQLLSICVANMRLVSPPDGDKPPSVSSRMMLAVGSGITHGEHLPVKGRLMLFDVAKQALHRSVMS